MLPRIEHLAKHSPDHCSFRHCGKAIVPYARAAKQLFIPQLRQCNCSFCNCGNAFVPSATAAR